MCLALEDGPAHICCDGSTVFLFQVRSPVGLNGRPAGREQKKNGKKKRKRDKNKDARAGSMGMFSAERARLCLGWGGTLRGGFCLGVCMPRSG